jgi:imidazolonepropionase-like amidohydrolase
MPSRLAAGVDSIEHGDVIDDATAKQMAQRRCTSARR